jgi:hypothetical protein
MPHPVRRVTAFPDQTLGIYFEAELYPAGHLPQLFDGVTRNVNLWAVHEQSLRADFNVFGSASSLVKAQDRRADAVVPVAISWDGPELNRVNNNFWPVCGKEHRLSKSYLPNGGPPQSGSECGNEQSREDCEKPIVVVNEPQGTNRLDFNELNDGLALILGSFGGLLAAGLAYAGLKRLCDCVFDKDKYG